MKWPWQRADPWTVHVVAVASGMMYRLRVHDDGRMEFGHGTSGPLRAIEHADAMDLALMRAMRPAWWTPPLPEGVHL